MAEERNLIADIAAVLALLTGALLIAALAGLLLSVIPRKLRVEEPELSAELAERVARDVGSLEVPDTFDADSIKREAARDNLLRRAQYAHNAVSRLAGAVMGAESGKRRQALSEAYRVEQRYLGAHRDVSRARMKAANTTAALVEQYGPRLRWRWGATRTPAEARPSHKRASGKVFDLSEGLPRGPDVLPGTLPGCSCAWEPIVERGR